MLLDNIYAVLSIFFSYAIWLVLCMVSGFFKYKKNLRLIGKNIAPAYQPMHHSINRGKDKQRKDLRDYLKANTICAVLPVVNILVFISSINKVKK